MTAFEIFGVLKLDKTDFDNGIKEAQNGTDKLFNLESAKTAINGVNKFGDSIIGIGRNAMNTSASFESAFTGVRKTVDATEEEYSALSDWILEASTRMASSKNDIAATMEIAGQLGVSGVEGLEKFTETMIMLGDTTNLNAEEAASSLAKFGNIAGLAPTDMDRIGAVIVDLGNHFATTESDIVAMSSRLASAGTIAGFSSTDILALSTAMSSVGINAEAGGTAMSTIMTKIGRAVDEGIDPSNKKLDLFAKTAGMSSEEFVAAWKTSPTTALQNFVKGLDGMVDSGDNVTAVLDDLGIKGIRETNTIKSLALASDVLTGAVDMANNAFEENSALTNEANLRYGTTESKMMQTQEAMSNLALELGDRLLPLIDKGISVMSELMKIWDSLSDGTKDAIVNIGLVLGVGSKLIAGIGSVALGINSIITVVGTLIPALAGIAPVILPIIAIIAAVIAIGVVLYKNWDTIKEKAGELWAKIKEVFENIKLDGKPINCNCQFAIYIKEEIDAMIKSKTTGKMVKNTHLGRKKLHYPQTLVHKTDGFNIDNKKVLDKILDVNGGFAYIVRGFECDTDNKSLNFITSLVGLKGIFLSSVFKKQKGVGKKLLLEEINIDAQDLPEGDIAYLVNSENKSYSSASDMFEAINKSKVENGKLGEELILKYLEENMPSITDVYHTSKDFPTSPYDIEFIQNGIKKYVEVKSTSGTKKVFNMSLGELKFMDKYKDDYLLFLVTSVKDDFPNVEIFTPDKISHLKKVYPNTRFYA